MKPEVHPSQRRAVFNKRFDQRAPIIALSVQREICKRRALGQTLKQITDDPDMPSLGQIRDLIWRDESFKRMYKDAHRAYAEIMAEQLEEKAAEAGQYTGDPKGAMAHVQAIRLQVDTQKWILSKILSEQYGDDLSDKGSAAAAGGVIGMIRAIAQLARDDKPAKATVVVPELKNSENNP